MSSFSKLVHVPGAALAAAALSTATIVWQTKVGIAAIRKDLGGRLDRLDARVEKDIRPRRRKRNRLDRNVDLSIAPHFTPVQGTAGNKDPWEKCAKVTDLWDDMDPWEKYAKVIWNDKDAWEKYAKVMDLWNDKDC